jgi:peptide-methionine (R)-S-oxide reductase
MPEPSNYTRMTDDTWRKRLSADQYRVLRASATEPPFSGKLLPEKRKGSYVCAGCGQKLFLSQHKFDSGSGWPSFYNVAQYDVIELRHDDSQGMERLEAVCRRCGGHLGHLFDDALDQPTGQRYCINSLALEFEPDES